MAYTSTTSQSSVLRQSIEGLWRMVENQKYPLFSSIRRGPKMKAALEQQPVDKLNSANTAGVIEGTDPDSFTDQLADRNLIGNYPSYMRQTWAITDVEQGFSEHGGVPGGTTSDKADALKKCMGMLKRNCECIITGAQDRTQPTGTVAGVCRGLGDWIDSAGPSDVNSNYRTPSGNIQTSGCTRTQFLAVLNSIAVENGGLDGVVMWASTNVRAAVTAFGYAVDKASANVTYADWQTTRDQNDKKLVYNVSIVETENGSLPISTHYWINEATSAGSVTRNHNYSFILNMGLLEIRSNWEIKPVELPDLGGGPRGYCSTQFTLLPGNCKGHGKVNL